MSFKMNTHSDNKNSSDKYMVAIDENKTLPIMCNDVFANMISMMSIKCEKTPMPSVVINMLKTFVASKDMKDIDHTTFRYIHIYLTHGKTTERLWVACSDFGYSQKELQDMRGRVSSIDLANEIINRS
jgi:phage anti-repressor protein